MSQGYGFFGEVLPNYNFAEEAAAGLKTSVQDFMKFMIASMDSSNWEERGGGILKGDTIDLMYTPVKSGYGLGVAISTL